MKLLIRSQIRTLSIQVDPFVLISALKQLLSRLFLLPPSLQRLLCSRFGLKVLLNESFPVSFYGLQEGAIVTLESLGYLDETVGRKRASAVSGKAMMWHGLPRKLEPEPILTLAGRLAHCCKSNQLEEFTRLLPATNAKEVLEEANDEGWRCVHYACFLGLGDMLERLLAVGVEVGCETKDAWTPLQLACYQTNAQCVAALLQHPGIDVNQTTLRGAALHIAVQRGNRDICSALLHSGASLTLKDAKGREVTAIPTRPEIAALLTHYRSAQRDTGIKDVFAGKLQHAVSLLRFKVYLALNATDGILARFESEEKYRNGMPPGSTILVSDITDIHSSKSVYGYKFGFCVSTAHSKTHYYAKSKETAEQWFARLKSVISASHSKTTLEVTDRTDKRLFNTTSVAVAYRASTPAEFSVNFREKIDAAPAEITDDRDVYDSRGFVTFSDFKIAEELGSGAFGRVYKVRRNGRFLALKLLPKATIKRQNQISYVIAENAILQTLRHPFVVRLYHSIQTPKSLGMVMELCPNGDLAEHISDRERFSEEEMRFYAAELVLAIEYLHGKKVVFRDMKPENILIDREGHIRLADFGIAKAIDSIGDITKTFCGSPAYLAPEVVMQSGGGQPSDMYGLGIIMYQMITGEPPFFSYNTKELFDWILNKPIEYPDGLSLEGVDLMRALLERDPNKRLTASAAKRHPFFDSIDWVQLAMKKIKPPQMSASWKQSENESEGDGVYPLGTVDKDFSRNPSMEECWIDFC